MATRVTPFDKTTDSGASGTTQGSNAITAVAGDMIIAFLKHEGAPTTISVADNKGNTYTSRGKVNHANGDLSCEIFTATANGSYSDMVLTATLLAARAWKRLWTHVYRPTGASLTYDNAATAQGTGTAVATGSYAVSSAGGAAVLFVGEYSGVSYTQGAGWTEQMDDGAYSEDRLLNGSEGTINGQATISASEDWIGLSISVAEPGGGGGAVYVLPLTMQSINTLLRM